jgi:hypothetical protein
MIGVIKMKKKGDYKKQSRVVKLKKDAGRRRHLAQRSGQGLKVLMSKKEGEMTRIRKGGI